MPAGSRFAVRVLVLLGGAALSLSGSVPTVQAAAGAQHAQVTGNSHHDTSAPLRDMKDTHTRGVAHPALNLPAHGGQSDTKGKAVGGHGGFSAAQVPSTSTDWEGVGQGFSGPQGTMSVNSAPPDTDGAVGPSNYVQIVNESFAVFNKTGTVLYGPVSTNTLFSGFGGLCQSDNDGDATAVYDRAANRWVISQFAVTSANGGTTPYLQCVAVSTTGDPTGSYNRYSFPYSNFPDYPKLSVWPDAYYTTFNLFNSAGTVFLGAEVAAYNRAAMLNGQSATQQTFTTSSTYGGLLGANVDSSALPAAGAPEWVVALGANTGQLAYWRYHVDWTTPANSTFTGPTTLTTQSWSELCGGGTCVPQAGTSQQLDSLADRIMYTVGYRNFGDHESLVVSHSVAPSAGGGGIAWYELRPSGGALGIYQQGVYAPDTNYRWMPSIAMDGSGDIGLGFSLSSSALHPAVHYTGRLATDALGTMSQGEGSIIDGAGSQTGSIFQPLSRWGDYSQMSIDPSDDCTFWYTNEYEASSGSFNWHTRIGSFKFAGCGTTTANDFSISASPSTQTVTAGNSTSYTVSTALTSGSAQSISLSASGLPSGATATFNPQTVTAGGSSTMTVSTLSSTPAGTSTVTITGTGTSATHSTTASLTVNAAPPPNDFSISVTPSSQTVTAGNSATYTVSTAVTSGSAQSVSLSASGLASGETASFSPSSLTAGGSSTLTVSTAANTASGTTTFTVTGTGTSATHSTTGSITVNSPPDFTVSATPSSQGVTAGSPATYTVTVGSTGGFSSAVSLSASGTLSGDGYSFNPTSVTPPANSSGTSTLTVTTVNAGTDTITITGTSGTVTHTASVSLTVNAACTPDFSVSASPGSITTKRGQTASYSVSASPSCGFTGTVSWSVTGCPTGATCTFTAASGNSTTLNVTASRSTVNGTYTLTIRGTSGSLVHTTTVSFSVTGKR